MNKYSKSQRGCLIALTVVCVATPLLIYHCASRGLEAEWTYEAVMDVLDVTTVYLENNPEWPKSWDDLEQTAMRSESNPSAMPSPDNIAEWKNRVYFDFSLTRADVAAMTLQNFTAIRAIGISFGPPEYYIVPLLEAARQDDGCAVLEVLTIYLRNNAEWPKDWTDLLHTPLPPVPELGRFRFLSQASLDQWKKRVFVDFGTTRERVAAMTIENFSAVRPIRAIYGPREQRIQELLAVARQQPKTPPSAGKKAGRS
jgi:hypothetical protein